MPSTDRKLELKAKTSVAQNGSQPYVYAKGLTLCMYMQYLGGIFPPLSQNTVGVCNQITFLILYYISSRLVTLLEVTDVPIQVPDIFYLTVSFKFPNFSFNPLQSLTLQSARDLNAPCQPKRSKVLLLKYVN
jgi:hypothetical protein